MFCLFIFYNFRTILQKVLFKIYMYINILLTYFIRLNLGLYYEDILFFYKGVKVNNFLKILSVTEFDK